MKELLNKFQNNYKDWEQHLDRKIKKIYRLIIKTKPCQDNFKIFRESTQSCKIWSDLSIKLKPQRE